MQSRNQQGVVLVLTILLTSVIAALGLYALASVASGAALARRHAQTLQAYYAAAAGAAQAQWLITYDETYRTAFEDNTTWSAGFSVSDTLTGNASYTVGIIKPRPDYATVNATGSAQLLSGPAAQRVLSLTVFQPQGAGAGASTTLYAERTARVTAGDVTVSGGGFFTSNTLDVTTAGSLSVDDDVRAAGDVTVSWQSSLDVGGMTYAANIVPPGPAATLALAAVDFDSASSTAYAAIADTTYTADEFAALMWDNQTLVLNDPITYVAGDVALRGGQDVTVNGVLVIDRDLTVGGDNCWNARCGASSLTVNHSGGAPAGVLVRGNARFFGYTGTVDITGLLYAVNTVQLDNLPAAASFDVTGALLARRVLVVSPQPEVTVTYDAAVVGDSLPAAETAPIITINSREQGY